MAEVMMETEPKPDCGKLKAASPSGEELEPIDGDSDPSSPRNKAAVEAQCGQRPWDLTAAGTGREAGNSLGPV